MQFGHVLNAVLIEITDHEIAPAGIAVGVSVAVRGTAGYRADSWTAIGKSDRHFCYYKHTDNIKNIELHVVSKRDTRMHSGWVVTTRQSTRNLAHAPLSYS
jgi:hypothetical protein